MTNDEITQGVISSLKSIEDLSGGFADLLENKVKTVEDLDSYISIFELQLTVINDAIQLYWMLNKKSEGKNG